ncbi:MAG: hypothetical protein KAR17_16240, partial [Cyclobacteriaceae bacterium]|nr:hypothetical protein [Cyclobacteriaceae bacterium]
DLDTAKHSIRYHNLFYWNLDLDSAVLVADTSFSFLRKTWLINEHDSVYFSQNGKRLFFGIQPEPLLPDTTLLEEEIVGVEVWNYKDARLHTQQNIELEEDRKKGFRCWLDPSNRKILQLTDKVVPYIQLADEGNAEYALGEANEHYQKYISWEGFPLRNDLYLIDLQTGGRQLFKENLRSMAYDISPKGNFIYWIDVLDSSWYAYSISERKSTNLTKQINVRFTNELNDAPAPPHPYGIAGWTEDDAFILIYDRYDIWKIDPTGDKNPVNLTNGRKDRNVYRYIKLDKRDRFIKTKDPLLFHTYNEITRDEGYASINIKKPNSLQPLLEESYKFSWPTKAL